MNTYAEDAFLPLKTAGGSDDDDDDDDEGTSNNNNTLGHPPVLNSCYRPAYSQGYYDKLDNVKRFAKVNELCV